MFNILNLPPDLQHRILQTVCIDDYKQLAISCKALNSVSNDILVEVAVLHNTVSNIPADQRSDAIFVDTFSGLITKVKLRRENPLVVLLESLSQRRGDWGLRLFLSRFSSKLDRIRLVHIVCALGYAGVLSWMLEVTYLPEQASYDIAFLLACKYGHPEIVQTLMSHTEVDPGFQCNLPIRYASLKGRSVVVQMLLADDRVDPADDQHNAFRWACEKGHTDVVEVLLKDGRVDPSAGDDDAVRMSAEHGQSEIVEILTQDTRVKPASVHNYALRMASANGHVKVVEYLLKISREPVEGSALMEAMAEGKTERVQLLMAHADIDPSVMHNSALRLASEGCHYNVVQLLLRDQKTRNRRMAAGGE